MKIPLTRPLTGSEERQVVSDVVASGWLTQGPGVNRFEETLATRLGADHAIAFTSCTTALHVALMLHEVGLGDEVIIPSYTWIATANVIRMVGATPVFVDIDLATFNVDTNQLAKLITPQTKVLMPVHQFGLPANVDAIVSLANEHQLTVIEDAACAVGSAYKGKPVGGLGNESCFSFHPRKLITTGEGGMLLTNNATMAERTRVLINHGASVSDMTKHKAGTVEALLSEEFHSVGYNYRMTDMQGALGAEQVKRLDEVVELRSQRADRYTQQLAETPEIITPHIPEYATPNWQSYAIRIADDCPVPRNVVAQRLLDANIACRPAYMACHLEGVFRQYTERAHLPNTEKALETVIILPLYPQMTDTEQDYVLEHLQNAVIA